MIRVKVRGIYSTALTRLFLDYGFRIVSPTQAIRNRFGLKDTREAEEVLIRDLPDKQGVIVEGVGEATEEIIKRFKTSFPEAIYRPVSTWEEFKGSRLSWSEFLKLGKSRFEVIFPLPVKLALDELRGRVIPTIPGHHLLKCINSQMVDERESSLSGEDNPGRIAEEVKRALIYDNYRVGRSLTLVHIKPEGQPLTARGIIVGFEEGVLRLERHFKPGGTYNGLDIPKEQGDWGTVELREGEWYHLRRYFSGKGELKGELYNINTPIELYPDAVRYIDLEIDVIKVGDEKRIIDRDGLEDKVNKGIITPELGERALRIAEEIFSRI